MTTGRTIRVRGRGSAGAAADGALLVVAAEATGGDPGAALGASAAAADEMINAAVAVGVDRAAVRTTGVTVEPQWDHRQDEPLQTGYTASTTFVVRVDEMAAAGPVLSAAVSTGGTAARVRDLTLVSRDPALAVRAAREAAFADARTQAEQYATLAGAALGELLDLSEDSGPPAQLPPGRVFVPMRAAAAGAVPVLPGSADLTVSVVATWQLAAPPGTHPPG